MTKLQRITPVNCLKIELIDFGILFGENKMKS